MGIHLSYDSEELLNDIRRDIEEFGPDDLAWAVYRNFSGTLMDGTAYTVRFVVNYLPGIDPPSKSEYDQENEAIELLTLKDILDALDEQDKIV